MKKRLQGSLSGLAARRLELGDLAASAWYSRAACACLAGAVAFGLAWSVWAAPAREDIAAAERREAQLLAEYRRKRALADALPTAQAANAHAQDEFARVLRRLPERAEVPGLVEAITRAAVDSGMTIERLGLGEEQAADRRLELPLALELRGGYHQFGTFAAAVAALPRLVTLHDFALAAEPDGDGLRLTVAAKTYRYHERPTASAGDGASHTSQIGKEELQ